MAVKPPDTPHRDRFDVIFGRVIRITSWLLGSGGFVFEVLSPSRTLWVGLLSAGLIGSQVANVAELLAKGVTLNFGGRDRKDGGS